jgi:hypothetical protein
MPQPASLAPSRRQVAARAAWGLGLAAALAVVPAAAGAAGPVDGPRPLSAAERYAVQLAADYLAGGPAAWWPHLARGSWLRALGREAAIAEIEVRAGLPAGARWTLQAVPPALAERGALFGIEFPSGVDDTLLLELAPEEGGWKIESLRVAAEPGGVALLPSAPPEAAGAGRDRDAPPAADAIPARGALPAAAALLARLPSWSAWVAVALLGLAGVAALLGARRRVRRVRLAARAVARPTGASFAISAPPKPPAAALALGSAGILALLAATAVAAGAARVVRLPGLAGGPPSTAVGTAAGTVVDGFAPASLRSLLPLRRALTTVEVQGAAAAVRPGTAATVSGPAYTATVSGPAYTAGQGDPADAAAGVAAGTAGARVARLWQAQQRIDRGDPAGAERLLGQLPGGGVGHLAELLRARLELLRLRPVEAAAAYERALASGMAHEGLLLEAAQALYILGFEERTKRYLSQLAALGARGADGWYDLAELALLDHREADARRSFRLAWSLQPVSRAELLAQPLSAFLLQDRELRHLVALGSFAEPVAGCEGRSQRALTLPPGVTAALLGAVLRLKAGGGEVRAPGACDLAPAAAIQADAAAWQEERDAAALARLPELRQLAGSGGALAQPVLRRRLEEAAVALAARQRWQDLAEISGNLDRPEVILPPRLAKLRAAALDRLGRAPEARQLLVRLALGNKAQQLADPTALYQLAGLLEKSGDFDQAMRLVAKADTLLPRPPSGEHLRRLQMEKRLAASAARLESPHFVVSYPAARGEAFAREAARILEAERERLRRWIPVAAAGARPIDVLLLPFDDFELAYSQGGAVLGLFDGVVRLPLGSLRTWNPFAVSILSHELAHALIAEQTADRAPHWFHEGLAQHVEMTVDRVNPIAEYRVQERLLAFPLLEPAISSDSSAVWELAAYDEALWAVNFIESRHGVGGIHRLLAAFRAGQATSQALTTALGTPPARFDHDLWDWCLGGAPRAWHLDVIRYDGGPGQPRRF